jgi:lipoate-protein ligase A
VNVRWLPFCIADGPSQMAVDTVMLQRALEGDASFRLYGWSEPTASLGYFQSHQVLTGTLSALPFVRRPTGGLTLVHHHEITYALAVPEQHARSPAPRWLEMVHAIIAKVLGGLGVLTARATAEVAVTQDSCLCFHHVTCGDLIIGSAKVVGSAQRRQRGALLQHGAILLATSPWIPTLPGIEQLTRRCITSDEFCRPFVEELAVQMDWQFTADDWNGRERKQIDDLVEQRFRSIHWNARR